MRAARSMPASSRSTRRAASSASAQARERKKTVFREAIERGESTAALLGVMPTLRVMGLAWRRGVVASVPAPLSASPAPT